MFIPYMANIFCFPVIFVSSFFFTYIETIWEDFLNLFFLVIEQEHSVVDFIEN